MKGTKDLFLKTAAELFAQKGYHATGIAEILKCSGAPKGSLYYHFPGGKEELAAAALEQTIKEILEQVAVDLKTGNTPMEGIVNHLNYLGQRLEDKGFAGSISITLMALENLENSPKLLALCKGFYSGLENLYKDMFLKANYQEGEAEELALLVVTSIEGAITIALTEESPRALLQIAKLLPIYLKTKTGC